MSARLLEHGLAATLPAEVEQVFWARVANHCTWTWRRDDPEGHPVLLALFVDDAQCALAWPADAETPPGESTTFALRFRAPPAGRHRMRLELVHHGVTYFGAERGPLHESDVNCEARAATPAGARAQRWRASSGASWLPGDGLDQARDGALIRSPTAPVPSTAMSPERWSCRYLESGLSFSYGSLHACAVIHHGRGAPMLTPYGGGSLPLAAIDAERVAAIAANQNGGHPACRGCPNMVRQRWPDENQIRWLGITHWIACNLACDYCWLQWGEHSPRNAADHVPARFFDLRPAIRELIASGRLARDAIVDWGGGGEPTLAPEFDELFELLDAHGTTQWLHTNATRFPPPLANGRVDPLRLRVLCSVDAGTPATFARIKGHDRLASVWRNLADYARRGARVTVKYLVQDGNAGASEIDAFVRAARHAGAECVIGDIDHRYPDPTAAVIDGLARLRESADRFRIPFRFGSTGAHSAPEHGVAARVEARRAARIAAARAAPLTGRLRAWLALSFRSRSAAR